MAKLDEGWSDVTLASYAYSEDCERDEDGDGSAVYFHRASALHPCDYACNGRRGEEIAEAINDLERRLGRKLLRASVKESMRARRLQRAETEIQKRLLDGFFVHYLSCTHGCPAEETLIRAAIDAGVDQFDLYDLALDRVGKHMVRKGIEVVRAKRSQVTARSFEAVAKGGNNGSD